MATARSAATAAASNDQQEVTVSNLELRLPVREKPGALDGLVAAPAPRFVPDGYKLSKDFDRDPRAKLTAGPIRPDGDELRAKVKCPRGFATCSDGLVVLESRLGTGKPSFEVATGSFELKGGGKRHIELLMTDAARDYLSEHSRLPVTAETTSAGDDRGGDPAGRDPQAQPALARVEAAVGGDRVGLRARVQDRIVGELDPVDDPGRVEDVDVAVALGVVDELV